jgi:uncharacterized membrane protein YvbJ
MFCQRCGMNNREGAQFCAGCAVPLVANQQQFNQGFNSQQQQFNQGYNGQQQVLSGSSGRAIASLMLSILGLIFCGWFTSIPGMILGKMEMNAIRDGRASHSGSGLAKTGFYMGIGVTALYGVIGAFYVLIAIAGSVGQ